MNNNRQYKIFRSLGYRCLMAFLIFSSNAVALEASSIKVSGAFRIRAEKNNFTDYAIDKDYFTVRLRPRFSLTTDDAQIVFTPQFAKTLGSPSGTSGTTNDPSLGVHEAFVVYPLSEGGPRVSAGRMILSYGDELVIGALEWNNVGRSFDAFLFHWDFNPTWIDIFASKINENNAIAPTTTDQDLLGVYTHFESAPWLQTVEVYLLFLNSPSNTGSRKILASGVRSVAFHESFDRRVEATFEIGDGVASPTAPYQIDGEVGYRFDSKLKPRLGLGAFAAGPGYFQLFPTAHRWLGIADVLGRRNLVGIRVNSEFHASEVRIKLDYHYFNRYDSTDSAYKLDGTTALGKGANSTSTQIGSELDLSLQHSLKNATAITAGASVFFSGNYLKDQGLSRTPTFYFIQFETKF